MNKIICDCGSEMEEATSGYRCSRYPICMKTKSLFEVNAGNAKTTRIVKCPLCDGEMKKRSGKWGEFYSCSMYFKTGCKGTRKVNDVEISGLGVEIQIQKEVHIATSKEDIPSEDKDVKLIETKKYPHLKFKFTHFNPVQSRVFAVFDKDANFVIAAATSAGKTAMAEMIMGESISQNKKVAFLSPLKAVSQEKHEDWIDKDHNWSKKNVSIVTGDYTLTDKRIKELREANVVIMTNEMLDTRTRRMAAEKNDWLLDIGTVVFDESHLIMMDGRGDKTESAIMRFTRQNPKCKVVFLSATMPNVSQISKWLSFLNGKETILINSNYRPIELGIHYETYPDKRKYSIVEENKINKAVELIMKYDKDKFIAFVHAKNTGRKLAEILKSKEVITENFNAELDLANRKDILDRFRNKDLRVIVSTSALAWGINSPCRRTVILGVHRGMTEVQPLDIKQMAGRAGRVGWDDRGDAHILLPESKFEHYKKWCQNIPPITSTFNNEGILAFHVVSEICEKEVTDYKSLMDWYNRSLAAFQHDDVDKDLVKKMIDKLEKFKIINIENGKYEITKLGQVAAHLYFNPYSIAGWYFNFNKLFKENIINDYSISWALANISDNFTGYVPKEYKEMTENFVNRCRDSQLEIKDNPAYMGAVFHSCLTYNESVSDFAKNAAKYDFDRISSALSMIDSRFANWGEEKFWSKLSLRIQYEVTEEQTELCGLKGIGGAYVRRLFNAGIKYISQIKCEKAEKVLGKKIYAKVLKENSI